MEKSISMKKFLTLITILFVFISAVFIGLIDKIDHLNEKLTNVIKQKDYSFEFLFNIENNGFSLIKPTPEFKENLWPTGFDFNSLPKENLCSLVTTTDGLQSFSCMDFSKTTYYALKNEKTFYGNWNCKAEKNVKKSFVLTLNENGKYLKKIKKIDNSISVWNLDDISISGDFAINFESNILILSPLDIKNDLIKNTEKLKNIPVPPHLLTNNSYSIKSFSKNLISLIDLEDYDKFTCVYING